MATRKRGPQAAQPKQDPKSARFGWIKGVVVAVAAFVAGMSAMMANGGKMASTIHTSCIEWGFCAPGNFYINAGVFPGNPETGAFADLLPDASYLLADYMAIRRSGSDFDGLELAIKPDPEVAGAISGVPYQIAGGMGYWAPEESMIGDWKFGFPILEVVASESGKNVDITSFEVEVLRSRLDPYPYVQLLTTGDAPFHLTLINESIHRALDVDLKFSVGDEFEWCSVELLRELNPEELTDEARLEDLIGEDQLDLSEFFEQSVEHFSVFQAYNQSMETTFVEAAPLETGEAEPKISDEVIVIIEEREWERVEMAENATAPVYGLMTAIYDTGSETSLFCGDVQLKRGELGGGGWLDTDDSAIVLLDTDRAPYTDSYRVLFRVGNDVSSFRTALLFASKTSASFDLRIHLKSFDRTIYTSDLIRANIFAPKDTLSRLGGTEPFELDRIARRPM